MTVRKRGTPSLEVDPETSARLGRIRQRDTSAEQVVRRLVHGLKHRFRVQTRDLPGSPDLANRSRRWAIFVHGCFWHQHAGCSRATVPKRNRDFWVAKFAANRARDARVESELHARGYRVVVAWECETLDPDRLRARLARELPRPVGRRLTRAGSATRTAARRA
jgi:DNA mismatch endonuclease (patch repair protein)